MSTPRPHEPAADTSGIHGHLPPVRRGVPAAVGIFVVVLLSLQVFLLTVAVDAFLGDDAGLAWVTAGLSVLLAAGTAAFYRFLR